MSAAGFAWLGGLAVVSTVGAVALFFAGLRRVGPTAASILSTLEPLVTVALAFVVFGDSLGPVQLAGGALVLSAVLAVRARRSGSTHTQLRGGNMSRPLDGKVALVTGATRGAGRGTAVALGEAGATVYCTGRSTREQRSEYDRPETIEETAELVSAAGGAGIAVAVDHLEAGEVRALVERIDAERGRLDVLVNDIWGGELLFEWNTPVWEHDLENGLRILRLAIDTHLITSHFALPLLIREPGGLVVEMTDGTREYNAERYRVSAFYDLAKTAVIRLAFAQGEELAPHGCTAVALTPGWMRSEMMLDRYGVTEANWRDGAATNPHFAAISETPRFVGRAVAALAADPDVAAPQRRLLLLRRAGAGVRLHRRRRLPARLLALPRRGPGRRPARGRDRLPVASGGAAEPRRRGVGGQRARREVGRRRVGVEAARRDVVGPIRVKQRSEQLDLAAADVQLAHAAAVGHQAARLAGGVDVEQRPQVTDAARLDVERPRRERGRVDVRDGVDRRVVGDAVRLGLEQLARPRAGRAHPRAARPGTRR